MKKKNIFIVEGKSDIAKLKSIYNDIEVIETGGIQISKNTLNTIKLLSDDNNLYIFTDPDIAGKKIRNKLSQILNNNCQHIYIEKKYHKKKFGVAEANINDIKYAIEKAVGLNNLKVVNNNFSFEEYLQLELNNKNIRKFISNKLKICYFNHKQFYKILNYLNISINDLKKYVSEYKELNNGK